MAMASKTIYIDTLILRTGRTIIMDIVYATDKNYAFITWISIISLFENNKDELINVYIIEDGITNGRYERRERGCGSGNY